VTGPAGPSGLTGDRPPGLPPAGESAAGSAVTRRSGPARRPRLPRPPAGIGRGALLIGGLTVLARILGLVRTVVFAGTVQTSCLGAAYMTANQVPNVIYDVVLGGALTAIVVPVLAGPAERSARAGRPARRDLPGEGRRARPAGAAAAREEVTRISSALLTWTVVILTPASLALALAAGPVISALMPPNPDSGCVRSQLVPLAARMLVLFAPQILLYGIAVVLYGILQSHRRFMAPALAPILSSAVVIGAFTLFVPLGGSHTTRVAGLPRPAELVLAAGTTAGVAALAVTALVPVLRLRLRLRPAFRLPAGAGRRARSLAGVGIAALAAQDASMLVATALANAYTDHHGSAVTLYGYGWQVFLSAYAVFAIPVAISAFPVLSARSGAAFDEAAAAATRATALASWLGAALVAAAALPLARAFPALGPDVAGQFALTLAAFAPGLVGYGLTACLSRVLLAGGRSRVAAAAMVAGWLVVIAADVVVIPMVPARAIVPALGLANTAGMVTSGSALLAAVWRARGPAALRGSWRALGSGLAGAAAGTAAGLAAGRLAPAAGHWANAGLALLAGGSALAAFLLVVTVLDIDDLRLALAGVRGRRRVVAP